MQLKQFTHFCFVVVICFLPFILSAQSITVKGKITESELNDPLIGATVVIKGTSNGTVTDVNGDYSLTTKDPKSVLVFSYTGYKTVEMPLNGQKTIDVVMESNTKTLGDVVVVGYGVQRKSQVTGAISSIKNEDFKDQLI